MAATPTYERTLTQAAADLHLRRLGAQAVRKKLPDWILYSVNGGGQALARAMGKGRIKLTVYAGECPCDALK